MSITICDTHLTRTVRYLSLTFEPVYFLNCHKGMDDSKIKVMIESDGGDSNVGEACRNHIG